MSHIILRDLPKQSVQLDLLLYQIQGGFRGFRDVPSGFHYGSILSRGQWRDFWCYLKPEDVLVKRFDSELQYFVEDTLEQTAHYTQLVRQQAMEPMLKSYPMNQWSDWQLLTQYIKVDSPQLHKDADLSLTEELNLDNQSRFEKSFFSKHQCDVESFLAEFQFSFLQWLMTTKGEVNIAAKKRWIYLLNGIYNAGESAIAAHPGLFSQFVDILLVQLAQLTAEEFTPNSVACSQVNYLIEDMKDTQIPELQRKARSLLEYIQQRQA